MSEYTQYRPHGADRIQRPRFAKSNNEIDRLNYNWWIDRFGSIHPVQS